MKILNREQIKKAELNAVNSGISFDTLMQRAGDGAASVILKRYNVAGKKIVVVCGNGNNGGDGFVIACALSRAGANVQIMLPLGTPRTETAQNQFHLPPDIALVSKFEADCDFVIDALFGIGLDRAVSDDIADVIDRINLSRAVKIAIDIPSGVMCDGGVVGTAVRANLTLTMIALKPCFFLPPSSDYCGEVEVIDICENVGEYEYLTIEKPCYPKRFKNTNKGNYGKGLVICGSYGMCGAEILASRAALRSGIGLLKAYVCDRNYTAFCTSVPEAVTLPVATSVSGAPVISEQSITEQLSVCDAVLLGCGLGNTSETAKIVKIVLSNTEIPVILDADGINAVCSDISIIRKVKAPVIVTPHPGEMARLCCVSVSEIEKDRVGYARKFAAENTCIVVLKGANTIVAYPDGRVFFNTNGNPGMATGGSGDVLAGIMLALLAQGVSPQKSAQDAVWLHSNAADIAAEKRGQRSMIPSDIIEELILPEEEMN